ncbi:MAG: PKD domain-containing protein [Candidatus Paceibacterota bacterium]
MKTSILNNNTLTKTQLLIGGIIVMVLLVTPLLHFQFDKVAALESGSYNDYDSGLDSSQDTDGSYDDYDSGLDSSQDTDGSYDDYDSGIDCCTESDTSYDTTYTTCYDQCSYSNQKECVDNNSYHVCGDYDSDSCLEWSSNYYCSSGEVCSNGSCVQEQTCSDQCSYGDQECTGNDSYHTCGDYDSDSCLEWSSDYYCSSGETCSGGSCIQEQTCSDQCTYGAQECAGDDSYHVCGDYDSDSCTEWSSNYYCNSDETCSGGECVTTCTDQSYQSCYNDDLYWYDSCGQRENKSEECGSDSWTDEYRCMNNWVQRKKHKKGCSYSSCYNYYNWENYEECGTNETCSNGSCVQEQTCSDQCSYGDQECTGNDSYHTCGDYDSDSCLEWSSNYYCSSDETCSGGSCVTDNQAPNADFSYSPSNPNVNDTISFTDQSSDSDGWISSYSWRFGDGSNSSRENPNHSYNSSGNYTVRLTVTDNDNLTDSTTRNISVGSTCSDQCSYSGQKRCSSNSRYQTCGDYDSDDCLEWSSGKSCEKSNSCGYGHCDNNQRPNWYCSSGDCNYNCNYSSSCDANERDHLRCYNDDVYWYDSNNNRGRKYQDCGSDYCKNWSGDYCYGGDVYKKRRCYNKGCSGGSCFSSSYTDRDLIERCDSDETCRNGNCVDDQECSSGPCCDNGEYKSRNEVCDTETQTQYGCPWGGQTCGSDLAKRTKSRKQYCSGNSSSCSGRWSSWGNWSSWKLAEECSSNEYCSVENEECKYSSNCTGNNNYTQCYNNDLYWYNPQGTRLSKYRDCEDNNSCTIDSCSGNNCEHELTCDGSTCEVGSEDYCESCEHCGDGICNCEETICSCSQDCEEGDLVVSISAKESQQTTEWQKDLLTSSNQKVDFLITVTNSGPDMIRDIDLKADLSGFIIYKDDIKSEGRFISGDITQGITLDQLQSKSTQNLTFKGKTQRVDRQKQVNVTANAETEELSDADSIRIKIKKAAALSTFPLLAALQSITRVWYGWPLVIIIIILLWLALSRVVERWKEY